MNRPILCVETRSIGNWRERLAAPETQWQRKYSAFETAVSWEYAARAGRGLPSQIAALFRNSIFGEPTLLLAIAERKVPLKGRGGDSQCDVWALVRTELGEVSVSVEAKAKEPFGDGSESLGLWLLAGAPENYSGIDVERRVQVERSRRNRRERWSDIEQNLPVPIQRFEDVPFQLLHRCAAAVIEARRLQLPNSVFVVQSFEERSGTGTSENYAAFCRFCDAVNLKAERGQMQIVTVGKIRLGIGWADCPFATDAEIAAVA